jgi:hypothetical protein
VINGLVVATTAWKEGKNTLRSAWKAMQTAGVDSGMTQSTTVISGMQGQWQESSSNFSNITGSGLLGFRTVLIVHYILYIYAVMELSP